MFYSGHLSKGAFMRLEKKNLLLYGIVDISVVENFHLEEKVEAAIKGGVTMIQLRNKKNIPVNMYEIAQKIQKICRQFQVPFIINGDVAATYQLGADGIHLSRNDIGVKTAISTLGERKIIGISVHSVQEALLAEAAGATYIGCGSVFPVDFEEENLSLEDLGSICSLVNIPVIAIGGITIDNVDKLKGIKIDGIASVRGIFGCTNITETVQEFRNKVEILIG